MEARERLVGGGGISIQVAGRGRRDWEWGGGRGRPEWVACVDFVRGRPRAGAETSGKAISWNRPPWEDRSTIKARSQRRRGEDLPCDAASWKGRASHSP